MYKAWIICGAIALFAIGCVVGIFMQRQYEVAASQRAGNIFRGAIGMEGPIPNAPPLEHWRYPGAESHSQSSSGGITTNDEVLVPECEAALWTTTDSFEDVIRFYAQQMEQEEPDDFRERRTRLGSGVGKSTFDSVKGPTSNQHLIDNQIPQTSPGKLRSARVESLVRRCRSFHLTVFITRTDDENRTHIIAVYDPLTANRNGEIE